MYVQIKKINDVNNKIYYRFFTHNENEFGIFEIIIDDEKDISMKDSFRLIKSINIFNAENLYLRAKGTILREYKVLGIFPEEASFMGG